MQLLKRLIARLPQEWLTELKRVYFARQIKKNRFLTDEPEYSILDTIINSGDWVIDIGANVGHYTKKFSELVGGKGRVIAFEPVPTTFTLLSSNVHLFSFPNVTLINAAVSDKLDIVGMSIPEFSTGLTNYYQAHLTPTEDSFLTVLTMSLDSLHINQRIGLVKIDAEGHEESVIAGMKKLLEKHRPFLIVENPSEWICEYLASLGYISERLMNSPNVIFKQNT